VSAPRRVLLGLLVAYAAALALALLSPSSVEQSSLARDAGELAIRAGLDPVHVTQARAEFVCNALILVPVSGLGALIWARTTWRDWTAAAFTLACLVELLQGLLLQDRHPAAVDVVANTLGGLAGGVAGSLVSLAVRARPTGRDQPPANGGRNSTELPGSTTT
jgi:hypothetical protein